MLMQMQNFINDAREGIVDGMLVFVDIPALVISAFVRVFFSLSFWAGCMGLVVMACYLIAGARNDAKICVKRGLTYAVVFLVIQIVLYWRCI
jgi:hypothetical protein